MNNYRLLFLDIEASSLSDNSYPIEIGYVDYELNRKGLFFVYPDDGWTDWDTESEKLHGIEQKTLISEGVKPAIIAAEMLSLVEQGYEFVADSQVDSFWLKRLFAAAGMDNSIKLLQLVDLLNDCTDEFDQMNPIIKNRIEDYYPHLHRAIPDAKQNAAYYKYFTDSVFRNQIDNRMLDMDWSQFLGHEID